MRRQGLSKMLPLDCARRATVRVTEVRSGQPEIVIANSVETGGFDLLFMGAYGHSRIRGLIVGSTTTEMVRSCLVPVVLFR